MTLVAEDKWLSRIFLVKFPDLLSQINHQFYRWDRANTGFEWAKGKQRHYLYPKGANYERWKAFYEMKTIFPT